jgi:hypothetical protein
MPLIVTFFIFYHLKLFVYRRLDFFWFDLNENIDVIR